MSDQVAVLKVSEVFGPTFQGEGPSTGRRCSFVRLARCNLNCSWCDTPYTWDWNGETGTKYDPAVEVTTRTVDDVLGVLRGYATPLVVITGGEPMLQRRGLTALVSVLLNDGFDVEIETNGTQDVLVPLLGTVGSLAYNVSPKLPSSGVERDRAIVPALAQYAPLRNARFKFVIGSLDDAIEVERVIADFGIARDRVWLMAQSSLNGVAAELFPHEVAQIALNKKMNYTGRLHVDLWGHERGH